MYIVIMILNMLRNSFILICVQWLVYHLSQTIIGDRGVLNAYFIRRFVIVVMEFIQRVFLGPVYIEVGDPR